MNAQILELLMMIRREVWERRRLFAVIYLATSMLFLFVGWSWPKIYTSRSAILVDDSNILSPLMDGAAVATSVVDRARLAKQIIYSRRALEEVAVSAGFIDKDASELKKEEAILILEGGIDVENAGKNLIAISYTAIDPNEAYVVARETVDAFIAYSVEAKKKESREAYEFINGQVLDYERKLREAEQGLKQFYSDNIDARPGSQDVVNGRLMELRRRMEATQLEIRELDIRKETLRRQLSGEAVITANLTREGQYRERLATLEEQLSTLRLSYLDTYPDIVSIKTQIATIEEALAKQAAGVDDGLTGSGGVTRAATASLLYQELRSQFSNTETQLASLNERLKETKELLEKEEGRMKKINEVEARVAELNRDYKVNQELYDSMSLRREKARMSMNMDTENQGLTFKIQEPAMMPVLPEGIRFAHFLAAGAVLSFAFPIGLIFGLTLLDQRVRSKRLISETMGLPVLASVHYMATPKEMSLNKFKYSLFFLVISISWVAYGYAAWLRVSG